MTRLCDGAGSDKCPRKWECEGDCHFNNAGIAPQLDQRWLDERRSETALIVGSWALVVFVVCAVSVTAYAIWRLL